MAYKVIIVDDNHNTVKSLLYGVDWGALNLEVAGTAYDGEQGKRLMEEKKLDIVITDINMPYMDGLSMVETSLDQDLGSKVIVITGYDKFQYASRAIKLSVFDYILKPIDDDELLTALERAVKSIQKDRNVNRQVTGVLKGRLILALMSGRDLPVWSLVSDIQICKGSCAMLVAYANDGFSQPLLQRVEYSEQRITGRTISTLLEEKLVILCTSEEEDISWEIQLKEISAVLCESDRTVRIGTSRVYGLKDSVKDLYLEAYENMLEGYGVTRPGEMAKTDIRYGKAADLQAEAAMLAQDIRGTEDYEKTYAAFERCTGGSIISLQVMSVIYCTKVIQKHKQWAVYLDSAIYSAIQNTSIEMFGKWLKSFLKAVDQARDQGKGKSELVLNVLRYMEIHTLENIKLEQVASEFYVSPNYLSSLISKETGITFQQHMMKNKMAVSKQMLDDTRMRVEEIAYAVGYENYVSFYNAFKRLEGITPSEYRMRKRE